MLARFREFLRGTHTPGRLCLTTSVGILMLLGAKALAKDLEYPSGEVVLIVAGNITRTNSELGAEFDIAMLEKLGTTTITTNTAWTDEVTDFTGVRVEALLAAVGAGSSSFRAEAIDDYWYDIKDIDFQKFPAIIAHMRNGELMSIRNLGPLWIMFPFDEFPELQTEHHRASSVWQLNKITVH